MENTQSITRSFSLLFRACALSVLCCLPAFSGEALAQQSQADFNRLKRAARAGDPAATFQLGRLYEQRGDRSSLKKAFRLYENSAEASYDSAQYALGQMYEYGRATSQNYQVAMRYYKAAASQGHGIANYRLGMLYESGTGPVPADQQLAVNYFLKARAAGVSQASERLDKLPVDSLGFSNSPDYILYMAEKGDAKNMYLAAKLMMEGKSAPKDLYQAFSYFRDAAEKDYGPAHYELGKIYASGLKGQNVDVQQNARLAVLHFVKAANKGVTEADTALQKYDVDRYLQPNNADYQIYKARKGGAGSATQQYNLYLKYLNGDGVPKDYNKAFEYLQMAALEKNLKAMLTLADAYDKGFVVQRSDNNAFRWYKEAANMGSDTARLIVADRYAIGKGTPQKIEEALRQYLRLAGDDAGELSVRARFKLSQYNVLDYIDANDLDYVKYMARNGNSQARMRVANYYYTQDNPQAISWLKLAAKNNNKDALRMLGDIYLYGKVGQVTDIREAIEWYYLAAKQNDLQAMKNLAWLYSQNLIPGEGMNYQMGLQLSEQYLRLTADNPAQRDKFIYKVIGDMHAVNGQHQKSIPFYTSFINGFDPQQHRPLDLLIAMDARAMAYFNLQNMQSSLTDLEIAGLQLQQYRDNETVKEHYQRLSGINNYRKGRVMFAEGNYQGACNAFQQARLYGIKVEQQYLQPCMAGGSTGK